MYWYFKKGKRNTICDVEGVTVAHYTIKDGDIQTGLTAIKPCSDNIFRHKMVAAGHVINGFGKPVGLVQVNELGTLETPIILTNTLAVGEVMQGLFSVMIRENPEIGREGTVNPVVLECNDGELNNIRKLTLKKEDVKRTLDLCSDVFEEGSVGAGRGMTCYDLKGGIGSASRLVPFPKKTYTIGVLVMSNFGSMKDLMVQNRRLGPELVKRTKEETTEDKGSIVTVIATDAPLTHRQLARVARRSQSGIARTGGYTGNGSGEITLAFSTANRIPRGRAPLHLTALPDDTMDPLFQGTVEAVEEAILSSLLNAQTVTGHEGRKKIALRDYYPDLVLE